MNLFTEVFDNNAMQEQEDFYNNVNKSEAEAEAQESAGKPILEGLYQIFYNAHRNTSFVPEKRANYYVKSYSEMLENDLKELGENTGNYKEKFIAKLSDWMHSKSRCFSSMITGGSNFPVQRAIKHNNWEHNKMEAFFNWREKYFIAVNRVPVKSPEDEIIIAERKIESLTNSQIELKQINAEIRKSKLQNLKELLNHLCKLDFNPQFLSLIDFRGGKHKIPSYVLTNLNARLKSTVTKAKVMQVRIDRKNTWNDIKFEGGYVTIADDRLKIFHDEKPSRDIINELKKNGYRWSRFWICWCRKHTGNAIYSLRFLSFINPKK